MFGIFKKKPPTVMDSMIRAIYGDSPPAKSADVECAVAIAHRELLLEHVPIAEIRHVATALAAGPMPYSTYDLSVAAALSFFKKPTLLNRLSTIQIGARLQVLNWTKAGKVTSGVAKLFEDTLYQSYKLNADVGDRGQESRFEAADRELAAKFAAFKSLNDGKGLHYATKVVRDFMVWQHNFAEFEKPDERSDEQEKHAKRIERAFLVGAAGTAAEGFSLAEADESLFLLNVVGTYRGLGPDESAWELSQMFEASDAEGRATRIGGVVMINYLANGKADQHKIHLAALQRACWG